MLTISTLISASRVLLVVPIAYLINEGDPSSRVWAAALVVVAIMTDYLDGYLARRWHEVTELGKIVDPIADKISVGVVAVVLVALNDLPLWYLIVVIVRDIMILTGGLIIRNRKKIIAQSNWPGKIAVTAIAIVLFLSIIRVDSIEWFRQFAIWGSLFFMLLSLVVYARRLWIGGKSGKGSAALQ